jgi:hypothetical protein
MSPIPFAITACVVFEDQERGIQVTQEQDEFDTSYVDDIRLVQIGKDSVETTRYLRSGKEFR